MKIDTQYGYIQIYPEYAGKIIEIKRTKLEELIEKINHNPLFEILVQSTLLSGSITCFMYAFK